METADTMYIVADSIVGIHTWVMSGFHTHMVGTSLAYHSVASPFTWVMETTTMAMALGLCQETMDTRW